MLHHLPELRLSMLSLSILYLPEQRLAEILAMLLSGLGMRLNG
jgi:hypothetical protein